MKKMVNRNLQRPLHKGQRCSCAVVYLTFLLHAKTNNLLLLHSEDTLFAKTKKKQNKKYIYIYIQLDVHRRSQDSALLAVKERNRPVGELLLHVRPCAFFMIFQLVKKLGSTIDFFLVGFFCSNLKRTCRLSFFLEKRE